MLTAMTPGAAAPPAGEVLRIRLRLFGKIGLFSGAVAAIAMLVSILYLLPADTGDYRQTLVAFQVSARNLPTVLWVSGAALAAVVGLMTWLLCLYGSFRIAGPLFRFARNLESADCGGPVVLRPLRHDDCLQVDSENLHASVAAVQEHYRELLEVLESGLEPLDDPDAVAPQRLENLLQEVQRRDGRVQL